MITVAVFYILAIISLITAILVIVFKNPVYSAMSLVFTMITLGGIFLVLGSPFVAAIQVLVYAGAIMVLFLFVIMLLNLRAPDSISKEFRDRKILAVFFGLFFLGIIIFAISLVQAISSQARNISLREIFLTLMTKYLLPFELVSVLLLIAIVGAVLIALPEKK